MNVGETAGQSVFWPHIHFIPRLKGDQEGEPKGIRQCYPKDPFAPGNTKEDYFEMQARLKKERRAYIDKMQKKLEAIGGKFNYGK
jgi:diadenosine tetraphosphate (Ap4A) HIT family hydrolase